MKVIYFFKKIGNVIKNGFGSVDLTTGSIIEKLLTVGIPIMLTSVANNLYEIIDALYLGRYSSSAIAASQVSSQVIFLVMSIAMGISSGGTTLVSQSKGSRNRELMTIYASQTFIINLILSVIIALSVLMFSKDILQLMNTPQSTMSQAQSYLNIILGFTPILFLATTVESILRGIGNILTPLLLMMGTVLLNALLNPIFIFGWGIVPSMGVSGAAITTVISRSCVVIIGIIVLLRKNSGLDIHLKYFKPRLHKIKNILKVGLPVSVSTIGISLGFTIAVGMVGMMAQMYFGGADYVLSSYGIVVKVSSLYLLIAIGLSHAVAIMVGQNIGADSMDRAEATVKSAIKLSVVLLSIGGVILFFFGEEVSTMFIPRDKDFSAETAILVGNGLRIFSHSMIAFGVLFIMYGAFQGTGKTLPMMVLNLARIWLFTLPITYILSFKMGLQINGYWWGIALANDITSLLGFVYFLSGRWKASSMVKHDGLHKSDRTTPT